MPEVNDKKDEVSSKLNDCSIVESNTDNKWSKVKEEENTKMKEIMLPFKEKLILE